MRFLAFLLLPLALGLTGAGNTSIEVGIDPNVNTVAIVFEIADKGFMQFHSGQPIQRPLADAIRAEFAAAAHDPAIVETDALADNGFWIDKMFALALNVGRFPNASIEQVEQHAPYLLAAAGNGDAVRGRAVLGRYIAAMNAFYVNTHVEDFLTRHAAEYQCAADEVRAHVPGSRFVQTMERFYGRSFAGYRIVLAPSVWPTMGFAAHQQRADGVVTVNVAAPLTYESDAAHYGCGYADPTKAEELSVHEFGHSFVGPVLDQLHDAVDASACLYAPIAESMRQQVYGSWRNALEEHIVRTGEIRIALAMGERSRADRLRDDYVNHRSFIYIPRLEASIVRYEHNRRRYPDLASFAPELIASLGAPAACGNSPTAPH
jgi:hypothetical protein